MRTGPHFSNSARIFLAGSDCGFGPAATTARTKQKDETRMQVTETLNEGLKRGYKIVVPASELEAKVNAKIDDARENFAMKGFRKGKAPAALMKKMFGKSVLGEAMQETVDGAISEHFESSGDQPAGQPDVKMAKDDWKEGDDLEVDLTYERLPDVPKVEFGKIKLTRLVAEVADKEVEEALGNLAENANHFEPRKKGSKAKDGDQVVIDFKGRHLEYSAAVSDSSSRKYISDI